METKLDRAIDATDKFITNLHRGGFDRGCIAKFSNYLTIRQEFTKVESDLHNSLDNLRHTASGNTRLYDSMCDLIDETFCQSGNRSRPWIMIVVTDGNDVCSKRTAEECAEEICYKFTKESSNFLFLIGVGDDVNSETMETMAEKGNFTYIPVKDFYLLEYIFMLLALKVTSTQEVSIRNFSIEDVTVSWPEVKEQRKLDQVPIDYALLIDVSGSMGDKIHEPPPPKCFEGHDLKEAHSRNWYCDVCGKNGQSDISEYHCPRCNFDACSSHCKPGVECKPADYCPKNHPLHCFKWSSSWICNEDRQTRTGGISLRCHQCDYDICASCLEEKDTIKRIFKLMLEE